MSVIHFKPFKRQYLTSVIKPSEEKVSGLFSKYHFDVFDFYFYSIYSFSTVAWCPIITNYSHRYVVLKSVSVVH